MIYTKNHYPKKGYEDHKSSHLDPTSSQWQTCKSNLITDQSNTHHVLEEKLKKTIACTEKQRTKLALEIILILISHPKRDIPAFSLGHVYLLTNQNPVKKIIIKDLKEMQDDPEIHVRQAAVKSLDLISGFVHDLLLADILSEIFSSFLIDLEKLAKIRIHKLQSSFHPMSEIDHYLHPTNRSHNKFLTTLIRKCRQFNVLMDKTIFSKELEDLIPELKDLENFYMENLFEVEIIPYSALNNSKWIPLDSIEKIADVYANTFTEEGHLKHLQTYLNDDDYHIRQIGAKALINVAEFLLKDSNEEFKYATHLSTHEFENTIQSPAK